MADPSFDPSHAVRFDLPRGAVHAAGSDERLALVPLAALVELARSAPGPAVESLGRAVGGAIGRRAAARIGDPESAPVESFVTQLAGESALAGIGVLSVERWGRALVVVLEGAALSQEAAESLVAPLVGAALEAASGRKVWCTVLSRDEQATRVLVSSERAVGRVREWIASGTTWGEAITKLHGARS